MNDILDINTLFGPLPEASSDYFVDGLVELMRTHNVRNAATMSTVGLLLDAAAGNTATRAACGEHAELLPAATLNPACYFGDESVVDRIVEEKFCMLRFFPASQGWPVDFSPFRALSSAAARRGVPIAIQIERPGEITGLRRTLEGITSSVLLTGVDLHSLPEATEALRAQANWSLEISRLLAVDAIRFVAETVGAERLLFGTGAPARPVAAVLNVLRHSGLQPGALQQIASANARRLLNAGA